MTLIPFQGAPIRAEAQSNSTGACSGGSGGLIRLKAAKVEALIIYYQVCR